METLQKSTLVITIIGAINWGLIGLFDFNLVEMIFGTGSLLSQIIYFSRNYWSNKYRYII